MKNYKKLLSLIILSLFLFNHAYCNDQKEIENKEQVEKIDSIKKSFNKLINNILEIKKTVIKNYNNYEDEKKLKKDAQNIMHNNKNK